MAEAVAVVAAAATQCLFNLIEERFHEFLNEPLVLYIARAMHIMAKRVVEFSRGGYKIRKKFA